MSDTKLTEQIVGLDIDNVILFTLPASAGIDVTTPLSDVRNLTGFDSVVQLVTIPKGVSEPDTFRDTPDKFDGLLEDHDSPTQAFSVSASPIPSTFDAFATQRLFLQDFNNGLYGATGHGVGISGSGVYKPNEDLEQSIYRIHTRGRTSDNSKPHHSGSTVKYAYTSGYFGGSAGNIGGTGGYLEIVGTTTDCPLPSGLSLEGHQVVKIQFWFNLDGEVIPNGTVLFGKKNPLGATGGPFFMDYIASTNKLRFNASLGNTGASFNKSVSGELPTGVTVGWHHCQVERSNDQLRIFIDGVVKDQTEVTNSNHWTSDTNNFSIGAESNGENSYKGYMSDFHYAAAPVTGTDWQRLLDGPTGGTMATNAGISMPAEIGTGDVNYTKVLVPMHGVSGSENFVERGFNVVTAKVKTFILDDGFSGSTAGDTGIELRVSNVGVTGAATGFSAGYGFVFGFSGTGGTGGVTGAGVGGTQGFTGSLATYAISKIPSENILGITVAKLVGISVARDDFKIDLALGVSGSTANPNNLNFLFGVSGGNTANQAGGAGAAGSSGAGASGSYFDTFNFNLTPASYSELSEQASAVEAGFTGGTFIVDKNGTVQEFRPRDVTFLFQDVSVFFQERNASQTEVESNINAVTTLTELNDVGGEGNEKTRALKNARGQSVSYKAIQNTRSGVSVASRFTNVFTGKGK